MAEQRTSWRSRVIAYGFIGAVALMFLLMCSGLHLPIVNARGRLAGRLADDPNVSLPTSAKVRHAISVATSDPGEYYEIELDVADVAPFMDKVRSAMGASAVDRDASRPWLMEPPPGWWKPNEIPGVKRLDGMHGDQMGGYIWYYSTSSPTIYVFWGRT